MLVEWQVAQSRVVARWVADLPVARVPLWQLAQFPVTPEWLKVTLLQLLGVWQVEHCWVVAI